MRVLLIGPMPPPTTGQSLINRIIVDQYNFKTGNLIRFIDTSYSFLEDKNGIFSTRKFFYYFKSYLKVYLIFNTDIVYLSIGQTFLGVLRFFPYFFVAKIFSKKIVVHIHGNHLRDEYEGLRGLKKKVFRSILTCSDGGIVISEILKRNLQPFIERKSIYVVPNFAEEFLFEQGISKQSEVIRVIYLSNLLEDKGVFDFLEGLLLLKKKGLEFSVKMAGMMTSSTSEKVQRYIAELGNIVEYLGVVSGDEKRNLLNWGNVLVLPSKLNEGQPLSILEAMATGNVILTTKVGGIPDIFKEHINGFYIKKESPDSICDRLYNLSKCPEDILTISKNNRDEALKKYRLDQFINNLDNVFVKMFNI
ncbi:MAG: glycosyltransferase family 4 protein [Candidatus Atribacteria bacterium]|nr:glycosyltransferase family 4 protein [Candidatus Atribacteria bacterium]